MYSPAPLLFILVCILWRAFSDLLFYLWELAFGNLFIDSCHVDLVPRIVTEVEPVAETAAYFEAQRVERGSVDSTSRLVVVAHIHIESAGQNVSQCLRVHWPLMAS